MIPYASWRKVFIIGVVMRNHPHLVVYPVLTNEEMTTESQRYNCLIRNEGNAIPKHAGPEAKGSNPNPTNSLCTCSVQRM